MEVVRSLEEFPSSLKKTSLSIGNFDGLHLGHQKLLGRLREIAGDDGRAVVVTFHNHPSEVLRPDQVVEKLCHPEKRIQLLRDIGIDTLVLLDFTKELAQTAAEDFLTQLRRHLPFQNLLLGYDASFGKNREGSSGHIRLLSQKMGFKSEYMPKFHFNGEEISSTRVRELIRQGQLAEVERLLGRTFSIHGTVISGQNQGKSLGFPTANISLDGLCHPPLGVYAVRAQFDNKLVTGVANLGTAPTVKQEAKPLLEVHLFQETKALYGRSLEVSFESYLRPEQRFSSIDALQGQIAEDVKQAKGFFSGL